MPSPSPTSHRAPSSPPAKGRPRVLSPELAIKTARELVQRDGMATLTLKKLAAELNVGLTTVHNAVGGKDQLLQAIADQVFADLPARESLPADPRTALEAYATEVHRVLCDEPDVARLAGLQRMHNPSYFRDIETFLRLLVECGLQPERAYQVHNTLGSYILGSALLALARRDSARDAAIAALPADEFPTLHAVRPLMSGHDTDRQFRSGLCEYLDALLCSDRSAPPRHAAL